MEIPSLEDFQGMSPEEQDALLDTLVEHTVKKLASLSTRQLALMAVDNVYFLNQMKALATIGLDTRAEIEAVEMILALIHKEVDRRLEQM